MATIEKLIKAFEALKVFQAASLNVEDVVKRKEQHISKKEKMSNCNLVADCICAPNMRSISDFPKFLGIAMETFLHMCDDPESDVRMVADECLNRTIKTLLETNLGRLQVELYKEIKKNGAPRSLRAALSRFAEMAHLIRPQKCRPYIVNLLPCLTRICQREEESIQEVLLATMTKICPVLMSFANDAEVKILLKAFLEDLNSSMASCRRTAASSLPLICQYSRNPCLFYNFLLNNLLEMVLPVDNEISVHKLLGVIVCLRSLIPHLANPGPNDEGMKGSFGIMAKKKEEAVSKDQLMKLYQLLLYHLGHQDHNVVNACLEALQQLLRTPPAELRDMLTTLGSIKMTYIYQKDMEGESFRGGEVTAASSGTSLPSLSEDTSLDDESEIYPTSQSADTAYVSDLDVSSLPSTVESFKDTANNQASLDEGTPETAVILTTESDYTGIEIGEVTDEKSERSNLSTVNSVSQETLLSIQSLSPSHKPMQTVGVNQDLNGNPELLDEDDISEPTSPFTIMPTVDPVKDLISSPEDSIPLLHCVRLICSRFLLAGQTHMLLPDRKVRVSVKALALGVISCAVGIKPSIFLEHLSDDAGSQALRDILLYATHPDPQLKGNTSVVIGSLVSTVLTESRENFSAWVRLNRAKDGESLTIDKLIEVLLCITEDQSSVAARLALTALRACLPQLLYSVHSEVGLRALLRLISVTNNPYWLVKVELLELLQTLDFKVVAYLESTCVTVNRGPHHYLGKLDLQKHLIHSVFIRCLADEDMRVRRSAALALVRLVPKLYYPVDSHFQNPAVAIAKEYTDNFLNPIMHDWAIEPPTIVQGLVKPYHVSPDVISDFTVENSLSRIVIALLYELNLSQSKHLTSGCCLALCLLSEAYTTSLYPYAWGCGIPTPIQPRESSSKVKRPPTRSLSSSSSLSLDELNPGSGGGPLPIILSLLISSSVSHDIASHQTALQLAGNLIAGAAYKCLRSPDDVVCTSGQPDEVSWLVISDRVLAAIIDTLLTHVARLLNVYTHVIEEQLPGPAHVKTSLPSLPNAPSLSPIKRKARGEKDASTGQTSATQQQESKNKEKQAQKEKENEKDKNRKEGLGSFYAQPHYLKLYDVIKGAYSNYKISLDLHFVDKFCQLLRTALQVLAQILEIATLHDIGKYSEEFLSYLKATIVLEPVITVLCVQQLLKALFGTNLCSQWEGQQGSALCQKPWKAKPLSSGARVGLYHYGFTMPYSHFTQSLAGATFRASTVEQADPSGVLAWLKKCVERKIPAILKPSSKADKTAIGSYIRLFEPLVIKALKQYTVTSSLELQQQVLDLLSQLVQLRVNYCLLDSDQVFIGFVIKQFEYIEEGQIRNSEILIPNIFNFLVMLSYEKFHSKTIIGMPKIIQLCDGIMASGLQPTTHAIPALQPIVYDLFLLRGSNKSDISKDLETQREVVVSMLLRLIQYHQALDMFVIVLQQCHRESEERWKRLSRQVTDILLPALAKQQINLVSQKALDVLHRLFESVAPIVFRPVDILLKTLFSCPVDMTSSHCLERWICLLLSVLRVLMVQSKEEVILSRLQEIGLKVNVFKLLVTELSNKDKSFVAALGPEEMFAWFLLQAVAKAAVLINQEIMHPRSYREGGGGEEVGGGTRKGDGKAGGEFLAQLLAHLLMYITHMFQSGLFRRVATAAVKLLRQETPTCFHGVPEINEEFVLLGSSYPTLTLQWCNILILLNFDNQNFWGQIIQTPQKYIMSTSSTVPLLGLSGTNTETESDDQEMGSATSIRLKRNSCNLEILRRGGLILFCDYACENLSDAEHMTWVIINHVSDLIELSQESPVHDFISAIHRNPAASSLLIQAVHARCEHVFKPSIVKRTLKCLDAIHLSQSGALLTLLIDKFLNTHHLAVARMCDTIACRRVEMLLAENYEEARNQLPEEDLDKLLAFMKTRKLTTRHARLTSLLMKFRNVSCTDAEAPILGIASKLPQAALLLTMKNAKINKEYYMSIVKEQCFCSSPNARQCAHLLQNLDYADILVVSMTKDFHLSILHECLSLGAYRTHLKYTKDSDTSPLGDTSAERTFDVLFQAAQLTLLRHINNIINMLPVPHQILMNREHSGVKETRYLEKIEDFFTDGSSVEIIFHLASSLAQYLKALQTFSWEAKVPAESFSDICRFCTLCMELMSWLLNQDQLPTSEQLSTSLQCMNLVLQNPELSYLIGQKEHVTWVCSVTAAVHQILASLVVLPGQNLSSYQRESQNEHGSTGDMEELYHVTVVCDQISELVHYLQNQQVRGDGYNSSGLPLSLRAEIQGIVIGLARLPVLNSFALTPPIVWKMGWVPTPSGECKTKLPPLPIDFLQDKEVLKEFIFRIISIGWISRHEFEETWMSLLGVLNPGTGLEEGTSPEEEIERSQGMVLTVRAITAMLVQTLLVPCPGNTVNGTYDVQPRDKPLGFLLTRCGMKLTVIRGIVEQEVQHLSCHRYSRFGSNNSGRDGQDKLKYMFDNNLEREPGMEDYTLGQICVESIWSVVGALEPVMSESDTTDSMESPSHDTTIKPQQQVPPTQGLTGRDHASSLAGLDVHSCLQFLLDLYGQWLPPGASPRPPLMLLNEIVKSVVCLSDLFAEREQFEWMLDTLFETYKAHPVEDEITLQYLNIGICKAAAVVGVDTATAEKLIKIIDAGLRSTHLSSRVNTLYGILYLLEAGMPDVNKLLVPLATDFLLKNLVAISQHSITSEQYVLTMWATAFYIMENYHVDLKDLEFPSRILQLAVSTASSSEDSVSTGLYLAILKGLERLLLTDVLSAQDAEAIVKLSVDRLCMPSPQRALAALGLLFTCMYSGKQYEQYSPRPRDQDPMTFNLEDQVVMLEDPESLILAMERVTVLFDRIKKGYPHEARVISRILPSFLADFFPPQDIMNKVIGEFISSQQPYPQLIARVVFQVFSNLHQQRQHSLLRDWVMLSLSNFTQRTPVAMAVWSLTCFFISASTNDWLRALLPYVLSRMGKIEPNDRSLFCLSAMDFYWQLTEESQRRTFQATFQEVAKQPDSPYQDLRECLLS
ncbi:hypothetical protein CHS0354_020780 [Potamilus streckersoni]|uniref:Huntingtin n=1 Tax=Potamilus streckersoni TaxID=2493646 RepID=A0AAE0SD04_9BIVA|nr:hypothetical protein CHS0354_020780 [Potamilus streckersoni]